MANEILKGIKVIDLTQFLAAPTVGRVLGEWGADVIKVEAPKGDAGRTQGAVFGMKYEDDENLGFDVSNMNKRFVTLNMKTEEGMQAFKDLLKTANVFLTSVRTKSLEHMGITWEELHKEFPKLVFAQDRGYGEFGPKRDAAGYDATAYQARGGVQGTTVDKGGNPYNPVNGYGDFQVSMTLAAGICAALLQAQRTGQGDKVTVNLNHAAIFMQNIAMVSAQYGNEYPKSRKEVTNPFNDTYKTADDRWFVLCVPEYDRDFDKVMHDIGRDDVKGDARYNKMDTLNANGTSNEVIAILEDAFKKKPLKYWIDLFGKEDLPLEACQVPEEIYQDPEALDNDEIRLMEFPSGAKRFIPTNPVRFSSQGKPKLTPSRAQGSDTCEVLKDDLGYSEEKIAQMLADGAAYGVHHLGEPIK
ncbi:CoA transferase [Lactobacillus sp. ESL0791]|uniref:CaiB/BaiF CoA transferase family protein n=1 Tax=Lactobacillus sp. ESL0791 TaxID=2983234 RepID=UPI0023F669E3|nr:CoA transferase [Lactobacillus sp. ESL0791]MDF7639909.1 CoA transferase [Lactobacillus sp. ESL0791]